MHTNIHLAGLVIGMFILMTGVRAQTGTTTPPPPLGNNFRPLAGPPPTASVPVRPNPKALAFDAVQKTFDAKSGQTKAEFVFAVTNVSSEEVVISKVQTSCGCTAARLPVEPWRIEPGQGGVIGVTVDLTGKYGVINKTATIHSSAGMFPLQVRINLPSYDAVAGRMGDRSRNLQIAAADRQAVFRGDCASCHVAPTVGKNGQDLYVAACGICHESANRASMVPALRALNKPTDAAYWRQWITLGKEHSLMPAFGLKQGGILQDSQIDSLVDYLTADFNLEVKLAPDRILPVAPVAK